ncbi:MAG TPA: YhbD family protein [Coriobacteriia bacterium]
MEPDLISKKDLLLATGISYGQLYRWKRKGLIPEDWFVRKSAFTGQETFFPRDKMLARVERILSMKDEDVSLDDIAEAVSPAPLPDTFSREDVIARGAVSAAALDLFAERHPGTSELRFAEVLAASVADTLLRSGDAGRDEALAAIATLEEGWTTCEKTSCDVVLLRKMGVAMVLLVSSASELLAESGVRVVARITLPTQIEQLKTRLMA